MKAKQQKNKAYLVLENKREEKTSDPSQRSAGQSASFFGNSPVSTTTHKPETGNTKHRCVVS